MLKEEGSAATTDLLALIIVGLVLRLAWFSGYGLGDDANWLSFIRTLQDGTLPYRHSYAHRFPWWLPTAVLARLIGPSEPAMIIPITTASALEIGLAYAIGRLLWGRAGAMMAALLLIAHPLDFAWSTMVTPDIISSMLVASAFFAFLGATDPGTEEAARRPWCAVSAVALFLAFHAKISSLAIVPPLAIVGWWRRDRLRPGIGTFAIVTGVLFTTSLLVGYALDGTLTSPYESEMYLAGMRTADAMMHHRATIDLLWLYPRWLFARDNLGDWIHGGQPIFIMAFTALSLFVPWLRTSREAFVWGLSVLLVMQFQGVTVRDGILLAAFRNVRHGHALVFPVVLLLTGYLVALRTHYQRLGNTGAATAVLLSLWASINVASKTHACFGDERAVARYLMTLTPRPVHTDYHLADWLAIVDAKPDPSRKVFILASTEKERVAQLAFYRYGYLVTGGGREPYYGCHTCIVRADELPRARYRLLREFPGPTRPTAWRPEPARVWVGVAIAE